MVFNSSVGGTDQIIKALVHSWLLAALLTLLGLKLNLSRSKDTPLDETEHSDALIDT